MYGNGGMKVNKLKRVFILVLCVCLVLVEGGQGVFFVNKANAEDLNKVAAKAATWDNTGFDDTLDTNYVGYSGTGYGVQRSAIQFDLTDVTLNVVSAKLQIYITEVHNYNLHPNSFPYVELYGVSNDKWSQAQFPLNKLADQLIGQRDYNLKSGWKDFDVTGFVKGQMNSDKVISFGLLGNEENDGVEFLFASDNYYDQDLRPKLELKLELGSAPIVTTDTGVSNLTSTGATVGGDVTSDGNSEITERGIVYSTTVNPTTENSKETAPEMIGAFTANLSGLFPNTTYHYRAYATNAKGTSYGSDQTFKTKNNIADLSNLTIFPSTLNETFASSTTSYTANVPYGTTNVSVNAVAVDPNAIISVVGAVNGKVVLDVDGTTAIRVEVKAEDDTIEKTYTITVTEEPPSNNADLRNLTLSEGVLSTDFIKDTLSYSVNVPSSTSSMTVTPTLDDNKATVKVNDQAANQAVNLNYGKNTIKIKVTAEDQSTTKTYTITVYRLAPAPNVTADDENNRIDGIDSLMEYQINDGNWTQYAPSNPPDLSGDITVKVRISGNLEVPASEETDLTFTKNPKTASAPNITPATTEEDTLSTSGLVITPDLQDTNEVTHYKISDITSGSLYKNDGTTPIGNDDFITKADGEAGLKFKPNNDANSLAGDTFSFVVQAAFDGAGKGLSNPVTASITVTEVNDVPIANSDILSSIDENSLGLIIPVADLLGNDKPGPINESGQTLEITGVADAVGGTVSLEGANLIFTPEMNYHGQASFKYTVVDNGTTNGEPDLQESEESVSFTIEARAKQPTVTDAVTNEDEKNTDGLVITPADNGGAATTHYKITGITGGILYQNDGVTRIVDGDFITVSEGAGGLKFLPNENAHGTTGFGFIIQAAPGTDGMRLSDSIAANIIVKEVNDAPIAVDDQLGDNKIDSQGIFISFDDLLQNDKKGPENENDQTLTIKSVENAVGGTVEIKDGKIIFIPSRIGPVSFEYTIEDNGKTAGNDDFKKAIGNARFTVFAKPTITLYGGETVYIKVGESFIEPGYSAFDEGDLDLTNKVNVTDLVNPNHLGVYEVKYNVMNSGGYAANEVIRTVKVVSADLEDLTVLGEDLKPTFNPQQDTYEVTVPYITDHVDVTASLLDSTASLVMNGLAAENGNPENIPLILGNNTITIVVTAQGGMTKTYQLIVKRSNPAAPAAPNVTADDVNNKILGADNTMEYSIDGGSTWKSNNLSNAPLFPGLVTVWVRVKANGDVPAGKVTTLIFTPNPAPPNNGWEDSTPLPAPTPTPSTPTTEHIVVDVDGENGKNLTKTPISRTTEPDGKVKDTVTMSESITKETVAKAKEMGVDTARILIPDTKDKVSEVKVEIPKAALKELNAGNLKIEIATENAIISIPTKSIAGFEDNLYFRVVPLKSEEQRKQIEQRAKKEEMIQDVAHDQTVQVLGRPMEIETNMQSREVSIVLPLKDSLPTDAFKRQEILDNLGVFIEHSDGTRELIQGKVVTMKDGTAGIAFTVTKFSTFTLIYMEGWKEFREGKKQNHEPYINGMEEGKFKPNANVTRAQMAAMLARSLGESELTKTISYTDVSKTHWAYAEIMKAKSAGIMLGVSANQFDAKGNITRAQMASIAYRWIQQECKKNASTFESCKNLAVSSSSNSKDVSVGFWAKEAIDFMKASNIMSGFEDNTFRPSEKLTRAQAVKVLNRLFKRGPLKNVDVPTFKDVQRGHWAFEEIEEAARVHEAGLDKTK